MSIEIELVCDDHEVLAVMVKDATQDATPNFADATYYKCPVCNKMVMVFTTVN